MAFFVKYEQPYGKEWRELIRGDLGGNEILDLVWAAHFLEKELGLPPQRIGLEGGSHGGYAVLRALTMPQEFNGIQAQYPFGLGICRAGFADLIEFYSTSNIPDWQVFMLGFIETEREKYRDRSPLTHFCNLKTPLFILHGVNDSRVSCKTMEGFVEKLRLSGMPHELLLLESQGHGAGEKDQEIKMHTKLFEFIDSHWPERG